MLIMYGSNNYGKVAGSMLNPTYLGGAVPRIR